MTEAAVEIGNIAGFQRQMQEAGMSARQGLSAFRHAGGKIANQTWFRSWSEVGLYAQRESAVGRMDVTQLPPREVVQDWAAGRPGQWATQLQVFVRRIGTSDVFAQPYTHITNGPHAPEGAMNAAHGIYDDNAEEYEQEVVGTVVTGVYRLTGRAA